MENIIHRACRMYGVNYEKVISGSRKPMDAAVRNHIIALVKSEFGFSDSDIAKAMGVSPKKVKQTKIDADNHLKRAFSE